jgi:hypothetical protein
MITARVAPATRLLSGQVLIAGGVLAVVSCREIRTPYACHRNTVYSSTRRSGTG